MKFRTGDRVRIRYEDREVEGNVRLASANGKSLALGFDAMLGGYIMLMPVLFDGTDFRDLLRNKVVEISPATTQPKKGAEPNGLLARNRLN